METPIVTLTTDWGYRDYFVGMVKGRLYSDIPNVRVVDITHSLEPFQLSKAIFVTNHACMGFPAGTIHIIDATAPRVVEQPYIVVEHNSQYYICMDNGLPRALFGDDASHAVAINMDNYQQAFRTFSAYDIFCPVAAKLATGATLADIGSPLDSFFPYTPTMPVIIQNDIVGEVLKLYVIYIDEYGNAILNITYKEFEKVCAKRKYEILVREMMLTSMSSGYFDTKAAESRHPVIFTASATGYLQIALLHNSAEQYLGLRVNDVINVRFPPDNLKVEG